MPFPAPAMNLISPLSRSQSRTETIGYPKPDAMDFVNSCIRSSGSRIDVTTRLILLIVVSWFTLWASSVVRSSMRFSSCERYLSFSTISSCSRVMSLKFATMPITPPLRSWTGLASMWMNDREPFRETVEASPVHPEF